MHMNEKRWYTTAYMKQLLRIPLYQRIVFCIGTSLLCGLVVGSTMPTALVRHLPMLPLAAALNILLIGGLIAISGVETWSYAFHRTVNPLFRGAAIAATVHLDFVIFIWPDQTAFWKAIVYASAFGGLLDLLATQLFGQGKALRKGIR